jgi:hypothetical protein
MDAESTTRQKSAGDSRIRHPPLPTRYPAAISWASPWTDASEARRASGSGLLEHQRRAADAAALEAPDREVETHRGRTVVELDDRAVVAAR